MNLWNLLRTEKNNFKISILMYYPGSLRNAFNVYKRYTLQTKKKKLKASFSVLGKFQRFKKTSNSQNK